jgi:hypothetical protein
METEAADHHMSPEEDMALQEDTEAGIVVEDMGDLDNMEEDHQDHHHHQDQVDSEVDMEDHHQDQDQADTEEEAEVEAHHHHHHHHHRCKVGYLLETTEKVTATKRSLPSKITLNTRIR